ncbi:MAG: hypothetical protein ABIN89_23890 [Chitinophagaceae bacterium]
MKSIAFLSILALAIILFSACGKEYSNEGGRKYTSIGTLKTDSGDCLLSRVNGSFVKGQSVNDSNYIDVEVIVTRIGSYLLISDKNNNIQFKGEGIFIAPGEHIVRLTATGIPQADGRYPFTINYGKDHCNMSIQVY